LELEQAKRAQWERDEAKAATELEEAAAQELEEAEEKKRAQWERDEADATQQELAKAEQAKRAQRQMELELEEAQAARDVEQAEQTNRAQQEREKLEAKKRNDARDQELARLQAEKGLWEEKAQAEQAENTKLKAEMAALRAQASIGISSVETETEEDATLAGASKILDKVGISLEPDEELQMIFEEEETTHHEQAKAPTGGTEDDPEEESLSLGEFDLSQTVGDRAEDRSSDLFHTRHGKVKARSPDQHEVSSGDGQGMPASSQMVRETLMYRKKISLMQEATSQPDDTQD
jgi:hypothetical protein